jgi:hypothetical protein
MNTLETISNSHKNLLIKTLVFFRLLDSVEEAPEEILENNLDDRIMNAYDDYGSLSYFQKKILDEAEDDFVEGRLLSCNTKLHQMGY